jgi:hypothetical protein
MKTRSILLTLLALTFILAPTSPRTALASRGDMSYSAQLLSPKVGTVVKSGQVVRVEWKADFPGVDLTMCETEVLISLDGGNVYTFITSQRNPRIQYFNWTVPQVSKGAPVMAILDIRFGCLNIYPETYSPQVTRAFWISAE